jgi:hypothetical protein
MNIRVRLARVERLIGPPPEELLPVTPQEAVCVFRAVLARLQIADPFPELDGEDYMAAFGPWFDAVEQARAEPPDIE